MIAARIELVVYPREWFISIYFHLCTKAAQINTLRSQKQTHQTVAGQEHFSVKSEDTTLFNFPLPKYHQICPAATSFFFHILHICLMWLNQVWKPGFLRTHVCVFRLWCCCKFAASFFSIELYLFWVFFLKMPQGVKWVSERGNLTLKWRYRSNVNVLLRLK